MKKGLFILLLCTYLSSHGASVPTYGCGQVLDSPPNDMHVINFASIAVTKTFNYRSDRLAAQLKELKTCYTDTGWDSYKMALKRSNTIAAIQKYEIHAISHIDGRITLKDKTDDSWTINVPLVVFYNTPKQKLRQFLNVTVNIAYQNKQLAIEQIVAQALPVPSKNIKAPDAGNLIEDTKLIDIIPVENK